MLFFRLGLKHSVLLILLQLKGFQEFPVSLFFLFLDLIFLLDKVVDLGINLVMLCFQADVSGLDFVLGLFELVLFVEKLGNIAVVEVIGAR